MPQGAAGGSVAPRQRGRRDVLGHRGAKTVGLRGTLEPVHGGRRHVGRHGVVGVAPRRPHPHRRQVAHRQRPAAVQAGTQGGLLLWTLKIESY